MSQDLSQDTRATLDRYLNAATRGLWGKQRLKARAELEEHLFDRIWTHQCLGLDEHNALQAALRSFGDARQVRRGFGRVYLIPTALRWVTVVGMLAAIAVLPPMTTAQVSVLNRVPTPACLENIKACDPATSLLGGWIDVASLRTTLQAHGIVVDRRGSRLLLTLPSGLNVLLPTRMNVISGEEATPKEEMRETVTSDQYISSAVLLFGLAGTSELPSHLQGWINPEVSVGRVTFTLGTAATPFQAYEVYINLLLQGLMNQGPPLPSVSVHWARSTTHGFTVEAQHQLQVMDKPGTVYGLVTRDPSGGLYLDAAPVDASGQVELTALWRDVTFVRNADQLIPPRQPLVNRKHAMLVRFTGRLDAGAPGFEIIVPKNVRSITRT